MQDTRFKDMPVGSMLVALGLVVALLIGALYYYAYAPQRVALEQARVAAAAAEEDANAARQAASDSARRSAALHSEVEDLQTLLEELRQTSAGLEARVRAREDELAAVRSTQDQLVRALQSEIADGQIQVERIRDSLRVDVVNEILFDSGRAEIKPEGKEVLRRVGAILKSVTDKQIIVQATRTT